MRDNDSRKVVDMQIALKFGYHESMYGYLLKEQQPFNMLQLVNALFS